MSALSLAILVVFCLIGLAALVVLALFGDAGGTWVKQDGTIIEWDGDGGGRILHPDGRLEEFP